MKSARPLGTFEPPPWLENPKRCETVMASVVVPDLVGTPEVDAIEELKAAGLCLGSKTTASSATAAAGTVSNTTPAGGSEVSDGAAVDLVISTLRKSISS
jgi:beta-lactam-binding protein with PASTA domain